MAASVEIAIDPETQQSFHCVFDRQTCLPIEPIQRYLNHCRKRGLTASTVSTYAYRLVDFWRWLEYRVLNWKDVELEELGDFANWYLLGGNVEVISEQIREIVSKRSAKTVNLAMTAIQGFYEFHNVEGRIDEKQFTRLAYNRGKRGGFLQGIVKSGPDKLKRIKLKEAKVFPGCLTDVEVMRLVGACTTLRDRLMLMLLRYTGMRKGELLGLHLDDVEALDSTGRIRIVRRDNPNGAWAKGTEREVIVLQDRKAILSTFNDYLMNEYPAEAERLGHGMLFVNLEGEHIGQPVSIDRFNKLFNQLHGRTGIKAHPHLFRHTYATRMLQQGYGQQYVQQLLGHRSIATTLDTYSHVLDEMTLDNFMENDVE